VNPKRRIALLVLLIVVAAVGIQVAHSAGATHKAKAAAAPAPTLAPAAGPEAAALRAAAAAMQSLASYSFAGDVTTGGQKVTVAGEFSAPDHLHELLTIGPAAPVELVLIGTTEYQRAAPGSPWSSSAAAAGTSSDPRATFAALAQATTVIAKGSAYDFELAGANAAALVAGSAQQASVAGTATVTAGQITDLTYQSATGSTTVHFAYSAFGTTPAVTAPAGVG